MADVAVGVAVVPPEGHLVAETDVSERVQTPLVTAPVGRDVLARQHRTKLVETARIALDLLIGFGRLESLVALRARPFRNALRQVVRISGEIRRSASVALDCAELAVEIVVLLLRVRPRVEPRRVSVGLFGVHSGLLADVDVRRVAVAIVWLSPTFVGIASEVGECLQKQIELHGFASYWVGNVRFWALGPVQDSDVKISTFVAFCQAL